MLAKPQRLRGNARLFLAATLLALFGSTATQTVVAQEKQSPVLYFFTNDGCAPCLSVKPVIDTLTANGYPIKTLKTAEYAQFAEQLGVYRTPTVVLIAGNQIVARRTGLVDGATLQQWFAKVGVTAKPAFDRIQSDQKNNLARNPRTVVPRQVQRDTSTNQSAPGTKVVIDRQVTNQDSSGRAATDFSSPTMIRGTTQPRTLAEQNALKATVRLKVEDDGGTSYATGTVIHTHGNESLVMTCGHVFRESQGQGKITAEYDFYGQPEKATGRLIDYEAQAKDIAIVVIRTQSPLPAVPLAQKSSPIRSGVDIFSIGCDHGEDPTIRHSQIKNRASYDGSLKYDIFGRPVDGRSGGGLFTESGHLIGVCNAAAVEVDEGIYSALDTLYWQLATTGLEHLFDGSNNTMLTSTAPPARPSASPNIPDGSPSSVRGAAVGERFAEMGFDKEQFANQLNQANTPSNSFAQASPRPRQPMARIDSLNASDLRKRNDVGFTLPRNEVSEAGSAEVVIMVRSKQNPQLAERIVIDDPTPELLEYLGNMQSQ